MDIYYVDGKFVPSDEAVIPVTDLAILRGLGAFDFMRTYAGKPFCLRAHLERLEASTRKIGLQFPWTMDTLVQLVMETLSRNSHKESNVRIIITGGSSPDFMNPQGNPRLIIMVSPLPEMPEKWYSDGIHVITQMAERPLAGAKSINYVQASLALETARQKGAQEAVYMVPQGLVLEGTTSNVFAITAGRLITPGRGILPGITRQVILDLARSHFSVEIRDVFLSELLEADEVFICGTNKGIVPVVQVDDTVIGNGKPGPKTRLLIRSFPDFVLTYDAPLIAL
ncbi:MAG: aminotransferase class IV [Deltaproteobacteria bacterium]|nr:aminotransferase class IV [Deltaproteobacteria bacterium]